MLPKPTSSFTIPSIHDDTELECRLYHPSRGACVHRNGIQKGAILAHPYAPLGGCIDDPVVQSVGETILQQGFVLGLFNFRGAGTSKGRTSWTGRPEQADYVSFIGFLLTYLHSLETDTSVPAPASSSRDHSSNSRSSSALVTQGDAVTLILGGYSYGSLIARQMSDIQSILSPFSRSVKGSAAAEVRLRAAHLASERNQQLRRAQRGRALTVEDATFGGEECAPGTRRTSRESRRSIDIVKKGVEASKARLHFKRHSSEEVPASPNPDGTLETLDLPHPHIHFLLISPVLPPVSSFLTMFSKPWRSPSLSSSPPSSDVAVNERLQHHRTFAIFGSNDFFTSSKKIHKWAKGLASESNSLFSYREVVGAGHFWHEDGAEEELREATSGWLRSLQ